MTTIYNYNAIIGYLRNRLKQTLKPNITYCVRFYVNIANTSPRGIDSFGAWFADASMDTITKCNRPLTYVSPQVSNPIGNIICDTLNWVPISGTFVATGNEKYMVIGNFRSDAAVNTCTISGPFVQQEWTDVCIDDVSCIEMDVAAHAGPDRWITPGDSVYIGRESDWAIDPYCTWYQLPNTGTAIDTTSGIWVKPATTSTYVVRQELECNTVKWDTVVVYLNPLSVDVLIKNEKLKIYPIPARDEMIVGYENSSMRTMDFLEIFDAKGNKVKTFRGTSAEYTYKMDVSELDAGIYYLQLQLREGEPLGRTFVVER